jgi:hypothetical protein
MSLLGCPKEPPANEFAETSDFEGTFRVRQDRNPICLVKIDGLRHRGMEQSFERRLFN